MFRRRLAVLTVSALILGCTASAVPVLAGGGVASAGGGTHKAGSFTALGVVVEGKVKVKFSCSEITGVTSLVITNLNVVDANGHSWTEFFPVAPMALSMNLGGFYYLPVTQESSGLWGTTSAASIPPSSCVSGAQVVIRDTGSELLPGITFGYPAIYLIATLS